MVPKPSLKSFEQYNDYLNLKSLILPNSIKKIEDFTFRNFTGLTDIIISEGVTHIQEYAFGECANLTNIVLPNSLKAIGRSVFSGCKKLKSIVIPSGLSSIPEGAFRDCDSLTSIVIPGNIKTINPFAFYCTNLKTAIISEGVKHIEHSVFSNLESVYLPESIKSIDGSAFRSNYIKHILYFGNARNLPSVYKDKTSIAFRKKLKNGEATDEEKRSWYTFIAKVALTTPDTTEFYRAAIKHLQLSPDDIDDLIKYTPSVECRVFLLKHKRKITLESGAIKL